jgi:hypothetical protein
MWMLHDGLFCLGRSSELKQAGSHNGTESQGETRLGALVFRAAIANIDADGANPSSADKVGQSIEANTACSVSNNSLWASNQACGKRPAHLSPRTVFRPVRFGAIHAI